MTTPYHGTPRQDYLYNAVQEDQQLFVAETTAQPEMSLSVTLDAYVDKLNNTAKRERMMSDMTSANRSTVEELVKDGEKLLDSRSPLWKRRSKSAT